MPEPFFIDHRWRFYAVSTGGQVGARGATKILGPIKRPVLKARIEEMLARMPEPK
ncbi:MAG: hypothetical protein ACRDJG_07305 [Actinomycetota bacterium]